MIVSLAGFAVLFVLLFLGVPIAFGMGLVGFVGFAILVGTNPAISMVGETAVNSVMTYDLSVLPMFILMGSFVAHSRLAKELYDAANSFIGHWRGGLAMATIVACGGFAAVSGSSVATAAAMGRIAIPSMMRHGYAPSLSTGCVAAGGTLGILIPPSVVLVLYGILTETNIGQLFAAGVLPGLVGIILYVAAVAAVVALNPKSVTKVGRSSWSIRWNALRGTWGIFFLFGLVMGGLYLGVFTATEGAGIGAVGAFLFALSRRLLTWRTLFTCLLEAARTSAIMFAILIGALIFSNFVNVAGFTQALAKGINDANLSPFMIILAIVLFYLILGCFFDSIGMILLTVPILYPIVANAGFDLIWFGVLVVVVTEIALITPPVGMNVYMIKTLVPDIPVGTIFRGVTPFIVADIVRLSIIVGLPGLVLWLPKLMKL
jgi:tripartite ATP-independent transporter DctM subunit